MLRFSRSKNENEKMKITQSASFYNIEFSRQKSTYPSTNANFYHFCRENVCDKSQEFTEIIGYPNLQKCKKTRIIGGGRTRSTISNHFLGKSLWGFSNGFSAPALQHFQQVFEPQRIKKSQRTKKQCHFRLGLVFACVDFTDFKLYVLPSILMISLL